MANPNGNPSNLRPFKKGDPRIYRGGRPNRFSELRELAKTIAGEKLVDDSTQTAYTRVELILRDWLRSKDYRKQQAVLEVAYGKVPAVEPTTEVEEEDKEFRLPITAISPNFLGVYRDIIMGRHTEYVFRGGRGSTKSSFVSEVMIEQLINHPEWHGLVLRQVANTLRDSVYSQLVWAINYLDLSDKFKCTMSPLEIQYVPTGQKIYFRGADDPLKIKSIKPTFGSIGLLWFEELDQFKGSAAIRSVLQSAIRGGDSAYIFKSFNPPRSKNNWVLKELDLPKENRYVHDSDYRSVPVEWLGQAFIDEALFLKEVNPDAYEHEYLGISTGAGGIVFENVELRSITNDEIAQFDRVLHGLDWGYYPDPAHYQRMHFDAARLTLYIFGEYRGWKHGNEELYSKIVGAGYPTKQLLIADSAEPKSIADFRTYGANIRPAEKGPESVAYSMKWLQRLVKIVIDPVRCPYAAEEFANYEYERNKDDEYISSFPDRDNHAIDSVRYGTNYIWRRRGQ
jgi:PBSX family phage terminase large subunit